MLLTKSQTIDSTTQSTQPNHYSNITPISDDQDEARRPIHPPRWHCLLRPCLIRSRVDLPLGHPSCWQASSEERCPSDELPRFFSSIFLCATLRSLPHRPSPMTLLLLPPAPPPSSSMSFFVVPPTTSVRASSRGSRSPFETSSSARSRAPRRMMTSVAPLFFSNRRSSASPTTTRRLAIPPHPPHRRRHSSSPLPPSLSSWDVAVSSRPPSPAQVHLILVRSGDNIIIPCRPACYL